MKEIEIYVHSIKDPEPSLLTISLSADAGDLRKRIKELIAEQGGDYLYLEDEAEPLGGSGALESLGIRNRAHVHCHRCKKVGVTVVYNGLEKSETFPPSARVRRVLKWAIDAFQLKGADAENKLLRLTTAAQTELSNDWHIGSFVTEQCSVKFALVPSIRFQG